MLTTPKKEDINHPKTYRLSVDIDEARYVELKTRSLDERRPTVELVRDAIDEYLLKKRGA